MGTSDLANRMKDYEKRNQYYLQKRIPVVIRVDGRSFHTFTKGFERPFDSILMKSMQETAKYMCKNIQGAKLAYVQSDEITIILVDYDTPETDCWFNYRTDKLCSVAASMATMAFNKYFRELVIAYDYTQDTNEDFDEDLLNVYKNAMLKGAMFDARCFSIPKEEIINALIYRQQDATRNSILSVAQSVFSHKEMQGISCKDLQNKMLIEKDINWNNYSIPEKRGTCCIKKEFYPEAKPGFEDCPINAMTVRHKWVIDKEIPIFTEDRSYIESLI